MRSTGKRLFTILAAASRAALLLAPLAALGQGQTQQDRNKQVLADVLEARPESLPMRKMRLVEVSQPALALSQTISDMRGQIALTPDANSRSLLGAQIQIMESHLAQILRVAPKISDTSPDPLAASSMNGPSPALNHVLLWNKAALDLTSIDFTSAKAGELHPEFGEQLGPPCTSRAMAIAHLAIFEALNAIDDVGPTPGRPKRQKYRSYAPPGGGPSIADAIFTPANGLTQAQVNSSTADESSAIKAAAIRALFLLYPAKTGYVQAVYGDPDSAAIAARLGPSPAALAKIALGTKVGVAAANAVAAARAADRSQVLNNGRAECDVGGEVDPQSGAITEDPSKSPVAPRPAKPAPLPRDDQFTWRRDPLHPKVGVALGSSWGLVKGFSFSDVSAFALPDPDTKSDNFRRSFQLTALLGGDPDKDSSEPGHIPTMGKPTATLRSDDQTLIGVFWAYDGTPGLCAPPRLYNMIATSIATGEKPVTDPVEMARLLATINIAMADAGVAAWSEKYIHHLARPATGIPREAGDKGATPYADWTALGAQVTNTKTRNFTPPFPSYPSGHATFGAAMFQVMRRFWGMDEFDTGSAFTFISDEYNGLNVDPATGFNRPAYEKKFSTFKQAEEENGLSRVYLGIHWKIDADAGILQGRRVGNNVYDKLFAKVP